MSAEPESDTQVPSYAPNAEDVVLWRALRHRPPGTYIDVGAHHPTQDSVTQLLYERGWRGVNIEPQPSLVELFEAERPDEINLCIGIATEPGSLTLVVPGDDLQRATFSEELIEFYRSSGAELTTIEVPTKPLSEVVAEHITGPVDLLKVDAEGFEHEVFASVDLRSFRPAIILAEVQYQGDTSWLEALDAAGYRRALFDGVNQFLVAEEHADELGPHLRHPASSLDNWAPARWEGYDEELDRLRAQVKQLEAHIDDLHASSTWRIGSAVLSPVRALRTIRQRRTAAKHGSS